MDNKADLFKREQYIEQFCCGPMDFRGDVFIQASESGALRYSNRESCVAFMSDPHHCGAALGVLSVALGSQDCRGRPGEAVLPFPLNLRAC